MRAAVLGLLVGTCWLQTRATLPDTATALLLLAGAAGLLWLCWWVRHEARCAVLCSVLAGTALGFGAAALQAQQRLAPELPLALEGHDLDIVGVIESLPQTFERGVRFNFRVEKTPVGIALPPRIALSWYAQDGGVAPQAVAPGERWQLRVRLRRPHGNANPGGFDYEAWLLEQGVRATGTVRATDAPVGAANSSANNAPNRRLTEFVPGFSSIVERARARLRERMQTALAGRQYAGVIVALVIGDQRDISAADWKIFNATGVGHLVSISGLHITMIAGLFAGAVSFLWRRSFFTRAQLPLLLPVQKVAALAGALCALLYVLLSGFGVPAQRTLLMLAVVALAMWFGRATRVSHVLCLALAVVVLLDPWAVLWPGFWLSFGAVAVILYAGAGDISHLRARHTWRDSLRSAVRTQYAISIGLAPLTLLLFSQVSLVSPVANALAIPVISFIVTPLSLVGSVLPQPVAGMVLVAAHQVTAWLAVFLQWLADMPLAMLGAPAPAWWMFALALAGMLWMLAPRGWPVRSAGLLLWLPLLLNQPSAPTQGVTMTALDVGQGTAVLIETASHRLLYDTGPWYTPEADGGNRVILPYLRARGIDALDMLIVSHNDNDHSGGAVSILTQMQVGRTLSSLDEDSPIVRAATNHFRCRAGQRWEWDDARFEILHPDEGEYLRGRKPNARSCTLKISVGTRSILLPGDIEAAQEARLLTEVPRKLRADVLLAPHHGSGTSSTVKFLDAVQPGLAIFQVGYRNRYRHPKADVVTRYDARGIAYWRTDQAGAVRIEVGDRLNSSAWRQEQPRYWHGR
jgi:competence protein ComEC